MRKVIFTTVAIVAMALVSLGFHKSEATTEKHYGGSASVSVVVYELIFIPGGSQRGKELARYDLNATAECIYDDVPAAKKALAADLERQKDGKGAPGKEATFSGAIAYDVDSCNK